MNVLGRIIYDLKSALVISKRYMRIYYTRPSTVMFGLMFPFFLFLSWAVGKNAPMNRLFPSLVAIIFLFSSSSVGPTILPLERRLKTLERLLVAPISYLSILLGIIICSIVYSVFISTVLVLFGIIFLGVWVLNPFHLLIGFLLSAFCFASMGMMYASYPTEYPGDIMIALNFTRLPLLFISGVFIPLENMISWQRFLAILSPLTYCNDLIKYAFTSTSYFTPLINILALTAYSIFFVIVGTKIHFKFYEKGISGKPRQR
ncbi:MAG TPA: ABC transporter permease [Thermoproteales archaeon]|nr:ABC transporter permease [Thermoproteales archaeon]